MPAPSVTVPVVGFSFRPIGTLKKAVESCEKPLHRCVKIKPEPDNEHDPDALMVLVNGAHVGYVPRDKQKDLRNLGDAWKIIDAAATYGLRDSLSITVVSK